MLQQLDIARMHQERLYAQLSARLCMVRVMNSQHSAVMTLSSYAEIELRSCWHCAQADITITAALGAHESCSLSVHRHVNIRQALSLLKLGASVPCTTLTVLSVHLQLVLWDIKMTVDISDAMQLAVVWWPAVDKYINTTPRCDSLRYASALKDGCSFV